MMQQQYRGVGVEYRGALIARVKDRRTGRVIGITRRLGRWRVWGTDELAPRQAARIARRLTAGADINQLQRQRLRAQEKDAASA